MQILVGTSGYAYKEWRGSFYPEKTKEKEMLRYYAERFAAVEINNTFYRLPGREMLLRWADEVPAGFVFVLKASQRITHRQRLSAESKETVDYLFDVASALGERLGPVLFQTPPFLKKDVARLRAFLALLPPERPVAFEFRHETWRDEEVHEALRSRNAALVCADTEESGEAGAPDRADRRLGLPAPAPLRLRRRGARGLGGADPRPAVGEGLRLLQARGRQAARLAGDRALPRLRPLSRKRRA